MRIGLTTTADRGASLLPLAYELGIEGVVLPCIAVTRIPGGEESFAAARADADIVVFTSARTIKFLHPLNVSGAEVFAVGSETAAAVEAAGVSVTWVGSQGVDRLIVETRHLLEGKRVVVAGAQNAALSTVQAFEGAGVLVEWVSLYATTPVPPPSGDVDGVVFGSPTAVAGWLIDRDLSDVLVGAIGGKTAAALRSNGVEPDAVPDSPSYLNTLECLAALSIERTE